MHQTFILLLDYFKCSGNHEVEQYWKEFGVKSKFETEVELSINIHFFTHEATNDI